MSKKFVTVMIAIWSIIALALIGLLVYFMVFGHSFIPSNWIYHNNGSTAKQTQYIDKSFAVSAISEINVNASSADISFSKAQGDDIKVNIAGSSSSNDTDLYSVSQNGGTLQITQNTKWNFSFFNFGWSNQRISITLPESYKKDLSVGVASGDVTFNGDYTFKNAKINDVSGGINASALTADSLTLKETSGDMSVSKIDANYVVGSVSGEIKIGETAGSGSIGSVSGDISCKISKLSGSLGLSEVSGDMQIGLSDSVGANISANTVSGDIDSDFGMEYSGKGRHRSTANIGASPSNNINASSVSGDINFSKS